MQTSLARSSSSVSFALATLAMAEGTPESTREWPAYHLGVALRFLALDLAGKRAYLPAHFPETTFHMQEGDASHSDPFEFMCIFASDCCKSSIGCSCITSDTQDHLLLELSSLLSTLSCCERARIWDMDFSVAEHTWSAVARLARFALESFGWEPTVPDKSCAELLNEYSYGAYSEAVNRTAKG